MVRRTKHLQLPMRGRLKDGSWALWRRKFYWLWWLYCMPNRRRLRMHRRRSAVKYLWSLAIVDDPPRGRYGTKCISELNGANHPGGGIPRNESRNLRNNVLRESKARLDSFKLRRFIHFGYWTIYCPRGLHYKCLNEAEYSKRYARSNVSGRLSRNKAQTTAIGIARAGGGNR